MPNGTGKQPKVPGGDHDPVIKILLRFIIRQCADKLPFCACLIRRHIHPTIHGIGLQKKMAGSTSFASW
jgi:hypothetical protein